MVNCEAPVSNGKACSNPLHQQMQQLRDEKGRSAFSLSERLQRAQVSHLNDSMGTEPKAFEDDLEENVEWFEQENDTVWLFVA